MQCPQINNNNLIHKEDILMTTVITNAGILAAANAGSTGLKIGVAYFKIGSQIITPTVAMTSVSGEVFSSKNTSNKVSYQVVNSSTVQYTVTVNESIGNFNIGNIGLYLEDDTLFALMSLPVLDTKIKTQGSVLGNIKTYVFSLKFDNQVNLTNFNMVVSTYAGLPSVNYESELPSSLATPIQQTYIVNNHTQLGTPAIARWYNNTWYYTSLRDITDIGSTEQLWLNKVDSNILMNTNIVDSCVYNISEDTYSGRWYLSCLETSWYNEPLSTTFQGIISRGISQGFPPVVAVIATTTSVIIYDISKPNIIPWMSFGKHVSGTGLIKSGYTISCVHMSEGQLFIGLTKDSSGQGYLITVDFLTDTIRINDSVSSAITDINISERNAELVEWQRESGGALSNGQIRGIHANASSWLNYEETFSGRKRPLVAVAHDGGLTILVNSTNAVSTSNTSAASKVYVDINSVYYTLQGSSTINIVDQLPLLTGFSVDRSYSTSTSTIISPTDVSGNHPIKGNLGYLSYAFNNVFGRLVDDVGGQPMSVHITKNYNTGWMPNGTTACWLSNSKTDDRTGRGNNLTLVGVLDQYSYYNNSEMQVIEGFGLNNYVEMQGNPDIAAGSNNWAISLWINNRNNSVIQNILEYGAYSSSSYSGYGGIKIRLDATGKIVVVLTSDNYSSEDTITSNTIIDSFEPSFIVVQREASELKIYVNGEFDSKISLSNVNNLSNSSINSKVRLGHGLDNLYPATNAKLALVRFTKGHSIQPKNIRRMYYEEKQYWKDNTKCLLPGTSNTINSVGFEKINAISYIGTDTGAVVFSNLINVGSINTSNTSLITNNNIKAISISGGNLVLSTESEAYGYRKESSLPDFINQYLTGPINSLTTIISKNINAVAGISSEIQTVAANITDIQNAEENAIAAAASAATAVAAAESVSGITGDSVILATGTTVSHKISDHLSTSGTVFHSRDFKGIDHTGATNSLSGLFKMFLKASPTGPHTTFIIDADDGNGIRLGTDVATVTQEVGSLNALKVEYVSTNSVKFTFSGARWQTGTVYAAGAIVSSLKAPQWQTGTVYAAGAQTTNGNYLYTTTAGGTSGSTAPTHTSGTVSDGAVSWTYAGACARVYRTTAGGTSGSTAPTHTSGTVSDGAVSWTQIGNEPTLPAFTPTLVSAGRVFLTVRNATKDDNNGIFEITNLDDSTGIKQITVTTSRTDNTLDESGTISGCKVAGQEPLYYPDNCTIIVKARLINYINTGYNFCICSINPDKANGYVTKNVHFYWDGGYIEFPARTITQSRKGLGITNTEEFSVHGYKTKGNDAGSFTGQCRNSRYGVVTGAGMFSGNDTGEDGWHLTQSCTDINISDMNINSGDDSISLTQEDSSGPYLMERIQISNCCLNSTNNSSFKVLIISSSASLGSKIRNVNAVGCHFGTHTNIGKGTLVRVTSVSGYEENVSDVNIVGCTMNNDAGGVAFLESTSVRFDYVARCRLSDCMIGRTVRNAIIINGSKNVSIENNKISNPAAQTSVSNVTGLTVADISYASGVTMRATFSGSPDLSSLGTTYTTITISGAANASNNGTFLVTAIDNTNKIISYTVAQKYASASYNESGLSASAYVRKQAGEMISVVGGDSHIIKGNEFIGSYNGSDGRLICALNAILLKTNSSTSQVPVNHKITSNHFTGFIGSPIVFLQNGQYIYVDNNTACNNSATSFITEGSGTSGNNYFFSNREYGSSMTKTSFSFSKTTSTYRDNEGSNSDRIRGTITIPNGSTSVTINIPNHYTSPTGATIAGMGWTRGYNQSDPTPMNLRLIPTTSYGAAKQVYSSYNSSTRNYTITADVNPGADLTFSYELNT